MNTEARVIHIMREHWEGLFPKVCARCVRRYETLEEYLLATTYLGPPVSYDAERGDWHPLHPIGILVLTNCDCGNTLGLSSENMTVLQNWLILNWVRIKKQQLGLSVGELLGYLHAEICHQVCVEKRRFHTEWQRKVTKP